MQTAREFDRLLAAYCSPTLAGIKPASLVCCDRTIYPDLPCRLARYREAFAPRGLCFQIIYACPSRFSLLVYHETLLARRLAETDVTRLLCRFGYPAGQPPEALLWRLERRMARSDGFPHEIGLFLGYPVEDVEGFVRHLGQDCKLSGQWKVYGDAEAALLVFDRLSRVCRAVSRRVERGETLLEVFAAAG